MHVYHYAHNNAELSVLEFLLLRNVANVDTDEVGHFDDSVSQVIHISGGFPFGNRNHNQLYVS